MAKIKWKTKVEIDQKELEQQQQKDAIDKYKRKDKKKFTRKELDELVIILAEERRLI